MIKKIISRIFVASFVCFMSISFASPAVPHSIKGLDIVINKLQRRVNIPVLIPLHISDLSANYCAFLESSKRKGYRVSIDQNCSCRGAQYCNVGSFSAELGKNPEIHHDMQHQAVTEQVQLRDNIKAYFTKGHALASYFAPRIVWRCRAILYTITWAPKAKDQRQRLIELANVALEDKACT